VDLNDQVRDALRSLIDGGLVHDAHGQASASPGYKPGYMTVTVSLNAPNAESHRQDILRRLREHGLRVAGLDVFTNPLWRSSRA
jgi:hypothetical protein